VPSARHCSPITADDVDQPFGWLIKSPEVARAIAFYLSDDSGMMTGNIIDYDQSVQGAGNAAVAVGTELGVPHTTKAEDVLGSPDVDAVAIWSSTDTHVPLMIAAAAAG